MAGTETLVTVRSSMFMNAAVANAMVATSRTLPLSGEAAETPIAASSGLGDGVEVVPAVTACARYSRQ